MVCFRETPAHQLFGIEKCLSINSSTDNRQTLNNGRGPQHGQHNCGGLHQSPGPDTFTPTTSTCPAVVELMRPEGSPRLPLRCIQSQLAGTQGLRVSSVQLDSKGPGQNIIRSGRSFVSSSRLASPTVVASTTPTTDTATNPLTTVATFVNRPSGTSSNSLNVPSPTLGRIPYLLQRYQAEGLPTNVAELLIAAIRTSTHKTYESSWKRWRSWCYARKVNPTSASSKDLLTFLTKCFDSGLQ